ncbi:methyltransferase domain-containing protein [Oricola sp.]|uniref:class I SAM-dependent methyltransferase n=1 Tax=Oricola sp. TaxID=1979950 RepID=UPI0025EA5796|nr:methyltransferase domain-containing protein [Oricola sp.]MCI5077046.1 methyltransferase domain-containing protein [Oricola sp.]
MNAHATISSDVTLVPRYGRIAPAYDRLHARWLRHAGGEAQSAFEGAVTALIRPNMRILDVGCGTGSLARRLQRQFGDDIDLTLVDACPQMLDRTSDIAVTRVLGSIEKLPMPDATFDLVTCSWALETTTRTHRAIGELMRVVRPGGRVCIVFCADLPCARVSQIVLKTAVQWRGTGRFLRLRDVEDALSRLDIERVRRLPCNGPAAVLVLDKPA